MKIQCENCGTQHELDPPSWVVSTGRAFRFRCSACGHSQSVQPNAIPAAGEEREVEPADMGITRPPEAAPAPPPSDGADDEPADDGVFLKQNGQIYMVRDWETLKRWIQERRVDRHDLVSEGGVRWEPVGSRADLMAAFSSGLPDLPTTEPTPFPFGGVETPFGRGSSPGMGWHDDDTEGVPTGLPPLPTQDHADGIPSIPPPALLDDDETPFGADPAGLVPPPSPSAHPTIAPPAMEFDDDDDEDEDDEGAEEYEHGLSAEQVRTAPGSVMRRAEPSSPPSSSVSSTAETPLSSTPPSVGMPSPSGPITTEADGDWDDLMATEASPSREIVAAVDFDEEWDAAQLGPQRSNNGLYAVAALVLLLLSFGVLWWVFNPPAEVASDKPTLPELPVQPEPSQAAAVPSPPSPAPAEVEPPTPTPEPVAEPEPPQPTPEPAPPAPVPPAPPVAPPSPSPAPVTPPPKPSAPSVRVLMERGWGAADNDPSAAVADFRAVIQRQPGNAEAHYGLGYTLLGQGNTSEGARYLCLVPSKNPKPDVLAEVEGILRNRQLSCP